MNTTEGLIAAIDANPGELTPLLMLADAQEEAGYPESSRLIRAGMGFLGGGGGGDGGGGYGGGGGGYGDGGYGDGGGGGGGYGGGGGGGDGGGGYGGGGGGGDGGGGYGGGGGGYGDGGDGGGYGGGGDGYGGDGCGGGGDGCGGYGGGDGCGGYGGDGGFKLSRGFAVESGLYIVCSPGGYYPYVRVAWCERNDLFVTMRNCRVIKRFGTLAELAEIAETGPKDNTQLLKMAKREEGVSVGMVSRSIRCNPEAWKEHCPKPKAAQAVS